MVYLKDLPNSERAWRGIAGVVGLLFAAASWGDSLVAVAAGVLGAAMALTGLIYVCPLCAMIGRKLDKAH